MIRRKLRCEEAILTAPKKMLFVRDFRAYMSACTRTVFQFAIKDRRCTRFPFTCREVGALDSYYFPRMPYACRFLDFRVPRFDNKLQLAFDRVRCWFVEVLLTSQLGRRSRCREKRWLDFEKCSTWSAALIFANCAGELFIASWIAEYYYLVRVSEIGRYFSWLLLCDRACPVQPPAFFLSRVLLLGFGKLLSIKKKCHCRFVVMCVGFTTNCQNKSRSKSLPPDIHPLLFYTPRPTQ